MSDNKIINSVKNYLIGNKTKNLMNNAFIKIIKNCVLKKV